ncbi:MAG: DUF5011 domain-containing protein [Bacteroidales bacterium]|nr:DUF5011 domain-containing protein [Bacteroidales bacterium]
MNTYRLLSGMVILLWGFLPGCREKDDIPPVITLKGSGYMTTELNQPFSDPGVTATDDSDGDITSRVYVESDLDIDRVGIYNHVYRVTDQSGNTANPLVREIEVVNGSRQYEGNYNGTDKGMFPDADSLAFSTYLRFDSTLNHRMIFSGFGGQSGWVVMADISGGLMIIPFQVIQDSLGGFNIQGAGTVSDTLIEMNYTRETETEILLRNAVFNKIPKG